MSDCLSVTRCYCGKHTTRSLHHLIVAWFCCRETEIEWLQQVTDVLQLLLVVIAD